jgi:hypothetical protein
VLRRDELLEWIATRTRDELFDGRYRVMTTSGSSGRKGLFLHDRAGWAAIGGQYLRGSAWMGLRPGIPRRRLAMLRGPSVTHMSAQGAATLRVGVHRVLGLSVTLPIEEQVAALKRFRPQFLNAYPSAAIRLAEEQEAGRLRLSLTAMSTSSELRTPAMTERIAAAFGVAPFDLYATTEGLFGFECERHDGIHLYDDASVVENVDEDNRPRATRRAGRARARHQPRQPRPADHPARGGGRDDAGSRAMRVRALAGQGGRDRGPPRRRARAARARRRHGERARGPWSTSASTRGSRWSAATSSRGGAGRRSSSWPRRTRCSCNLLKGKLWA